MKCAHLFVNLVVWAFQAEARLTCCGQRRNMQHQDLYWNGMHFAASSGMLPVVHNICNTGRIKVRWHML